MIKNSLRLLGVLLHAPRVPFIAPRQLGAVESKSGRPFLPSVIGRTGQSGAHRTLSGARFLSLTGEADRWRPESRWRTGQSGAPFRPLARPRVARRSRGRPLARPTVGSPDSPVNFSRTPSTNSRERPVDQTPAGRTGHCPVHHRTVWCTQTALSLGCSSQVFFLLYFL